MSDFPVILALNGMTISRRHVPSSLAEIPLAGSWYKAPAYEKAPSGNCPLVPYLPESHQSEDVLHARIYPPTLRLLHKGAAPRPAFLVKEGILLHDGTFESGIGFPVRIFRNRSDQMEPGSC